MTDVSTAIRKAYVTALAGIGYPVFSRMVPDGINPDLYVIIESVNSNDSGTISTQEVSVSVSLTIHSFGEKYSNGQAVNDVCSLVMTAINPSPSGVLDLSGDNLQMTSTVLENCTEQSFTSNGNRIYIDKILQYKHTIYFK